MPLEADNNLEESWEMPELVSLTSDYIIEQISFSKDSTRFAVSTGKNLHIFRYNESKRTFADEEKHSINIPFNFCWNFDINEIFLAINGSGISVLNVATGQTYKVIQKREYETDISIVICTSFMGKNLLVTSRVDGTINSYEINPGSLHSSLECKWAFNAIDRLWRYNNDSSHVTRIVKMDVKHGILAFLASTEGKVSAVGAIPLKRPLEVIDPWEIKASKPITIACFEDGEGFFMGRDDGTIYAASPYGFSKRYNFSIKVYDHTEKVTAISFYPRWFSDSNRFRYSYFVVAGTAGEMRFYVKDNMVEHSIHRLDYSIPVRTSSNLAYNLTSSKFQDPAPKPSFGKKPPFNIFLSSMNAEIPSVLHTTFSHDGNFFAYATSDGYIGILEFKLQKSEAAQIAADFQKDQNDAFWAMIDTITGDNPVPGQYPRD